MPGNEAGEEEHRIGQIIGRHTNEVTEEDAEDQRHRQRLEQGPGEADHRLLVADLQVAPHQDVEEGAVAPQLSGVEPCQVAVRGDHPYVRGSLVSRGFTVRHEFLFRCRLLTLTDFRAGPDFRAGFPRYRSPGEIASPGLSQNVRLSRRPPRGRRFRPQAGAMASLDRRVLTWRSNRSNNTNTRSASAMEWNRPISSAKGPSITRTGSPAL